MKLYISGFHICLFRLFPGINIFVKFLQHKLVINISINMEKDIMKLMNLSVNLT